MLACLAALAQANSDAPGAAAEVAAQLRKSGLEPAACYRVRELRFARDEIRIYFTDGYLIFAAPVAGNRVAAVFSADVEGGDAEVLLLPPSAGERKSLAAYTGSPNLNEHFQGAVFLFSGAAGAEFRRLVEDAVAEGRARPSPEMGALLASQWTSVLHSFLGSFEVRLVAELLSPRVNEPGFFFAAFSGKALGNFDLIWDPKARHQISAGQVVYRDESRFFDIWTHFPARSWRSGQTAPPAEAIRLDHVAIDATIEADLLLRAVTRLRLTLLRDERVLPLEMSRRIRVTKVLIDGTPAEAFSPDSLRANLLRSSDNQLLLITGPRVFSAGQTVLVEIHHEGHVIAEAGNRIYFVGARGSWYPNRYQQFARYDVTFRYPKHLDLVATGELVEEKTEGEWKISRRRTSAPVRFFGFNLGDYEHATTTRNGLKVEVCANRTLERALQPQPRAIEVNPVPTPWARNRRSPPELTIIHPPVPDPTDRLQELAAQIAELFDGMAARFGKPPLPSLTVSPIPGRFGQGFPGLVYLSTMAYLDPNQRPLPRGGMQQLFFSELLLAHEIAHQWWGNGVTTADYQDAWLMEALANYSALWMLEQRKGTRTLDGVLEEYKNNLLFKLEDGSTVESAGPITMGHRLHSSRYPNAWHTITYEKGSWILHMLRRRMGDAAFQKLLFELYRRHQFRVVTTAQFQQLAAEFQPPGAVDPKLENFFEHWVHGTGIPTLKLSWKASGRAPKVRLTLVLEQSGVDADFSVWTPVEIQLPRQKPLVHWMQTSSEPVRATLALRATPSRVVLDPANTTLARK